MYIYDVKYNLFIRIINISGSHSQQMYNMLKHFHTFYLKCKKRIMSSRLTN